MPLSLLNLDDRNFEQLTAAAQALIPKNFPGWTDFNPSDPGITLLELFAFLTEAQVYQINRVPERSLERFAGLVGVMRSPGEPIEGTLRRVIAALNVEDRAITEAEFEQLAIEAVPGTVARAKAVIVVVNTPDVFPDEQFVDIVLVPNAPDVSAPLPDDALRQQVFDFLQPRRLITTRVRVVQPQYTDVAIALTVVRDPIRRLDRTVVQNNVEHAVRTFLGPLGGGIDGLGWEFGRAVYRSELSQLIEGIDGVDHIKQLLLNGNEDLNEARLSSAASLVNLATLGVTIVDGE